MSPPGEGRPGDVNTTEATSRESGARTNTTDTEDTGVEGELSFGELLERLDYGPEHDEQVSICSKQTGVDL